MSIVPSYQLKCDHKGCHVWTESLFLEEEEAEEWVGQNGWLAHNQKHYCPKCRPKVLERLKKKKNDQ